MTDDETRGLVSELYRTYQSGEVDRFAAMIGEDIDWVIYGPVEVFPFTGARRGKAAVMEALAAISTDYAIDFYRPEIVIIENERAAVLSDASFLQRASQRKLRFRIANFLRFESGRLVEFRELANTFDVVEQAIGRFITLPDKPPG